jgi:GNAT superfamily N-acetyltransferase
MRKRYNITIKKFKPSDVDVVKNLIQNTIDACYPGYYNREAIKFFKDYHSNEKILKGAKEGYTIVLERNSQIVATGTIINDHIMRVFVDPVFQKNSFGKLVMQKLEEKALSAGISVVKLDASLPSKKFYDSLDYVTLEKTFLEVENGKKLDYYKMEKMLIKQ